MAEEVPFVFSSEKGIDLGAFEDVIHNHDIDHNKPLIISIRVDIEAETLARLKKNKPLYVNEDTFPYEEEIDVEKTEIEFSIEISYNQKRRFIAVKGFSLKERENNETILSMKKKGVSETEKPEYFSDFIDCKNKKVLLTWYNFVPVIKPDDGFEDISKVTDSIRKAVIRRLDGLVNIGPLREHPERTMLFAGEKPASVGNKGEDTFKLLFNDKHSASPMQLEEKLNSYLKKYNYIYEWNMLKSNLGQFVLKDISAGITANIVDVGFGISQVLPVAIQLYATSKNQMLLIEQPEIHLHSKAQADIADLLIDALETGEKVVIVETHSENLLLRLRRRVAEGRIASGDIAVYYAEQKNAVSTIHLMNLNKYGDIESMPEDFKDFFIDDYYDVMKLHEIKGSKLREESKGK